VCRPCRCLSAERFTAAGSRPCQDFCDLEGQSRRDADVRHRRATHPVSGSRRSIVELGAQPHPLISSQQPPPRRPFGRRWSSPEAAPLAARALLKHSMNAARAAKELRPRLAEQCAYKARTQCWRSSLTRVNGTLGRKFVVGWLERLRALADRPAKCRGTNSNSVCKLHASSHAFTSEGRLKRILPPPFTTPDSMAKEYAAWLGMSF